MARQIHQAVRLSEIATNIRDVADLTKKGLNVTEGILELAKGSHDTATASLAVSKDVQHLAKENLDVVERSLVAANENIGLTKQGIRVTMSISEKLDNVLNQPIHVGSTLPSMVMPTKPRIFYGRNQVVEDLACRMSATDGPRIAILGPGGMGKTSVALAVMEHPTVKSRFGDNRFWVPCAQATSPSRLLDIIASGLRITQDTHDRLHDIHSELNITTDPRAVLLDNFETIWNVQAHRSEVEYILCALAEVSHLSILVTMRSYDPPSDEIVWHSEKLSPLDKDQAHGVYTEHHAEATSDTSLDELLSELGYMPLAVTLMAKLGKNSGFMPTALLTTWRNKRTDMLHRGSDPKISVNVSIALSINSPLMEADRDAITLLAILCMLPAGAQSSRLDQLAPTISNIPGALATLTQSSLAEHRTATRSIHVLPLIRSYMLVRHPLQETIRKDVHEAFYRLLSAHKSEPGDSNFIEDTKVLAIEETNIQAVLMDATQYGSDEAALDALLAFSWYQYWARPRTEVIEHTISLARAAQNRRCVAEGLRCQGHVFYKLDRYEDACVAFQEARDEFQTLGESLSAAQCLLKLSEIYRFQQRSVKVRVAVKTANEELQNLGDAHGIADGLLHLGEYYSYIWQPAEAHAALEEAQQHFLDLNYPLGAAHCQYWISKVCHQEKRYDAAYQAAEHALRDYQRLAYKDRVAVCHIRLCRILKDMSCYEDALAKILQGLKLSQELGRPLAIAQLLEELGDVYLAQEEYGGACQAYEQSRERYQQIDSHTGRVGAANCLKALGHVYRLQSRHDEACTVLERACNEYQADGTARERWECLRRLEQIRAESLSQTSGNNKLNAAYTDHSEEDFENSFGDEILE